MQFNYQNSSNFNGFAELINQIN